MKKKSTSISFRIYEPCSQSFENMHPLPGGRFCDQCEKTVVDFTGMSDGEIVRLYERRKGRICGVFRTDQIDRQMAVPSGPKKSNWRAIAAFVSALLLGHTAEGQVVPSTATNTTATSSSVINGMTKEELFMRGLNPANLPAKKLITGKVMDKNGEPLIGASILIAPGKGVTTDVDGHFAFTTALETAQLEFKVSYLGFKEQTVKWSRTDHAGKHFTIHMEEDIQVLEEVVVIGLGKMVSKCTLTGLVVATRSDEEGLFEKDPLEEDEDTEPVLEVFPNPFATSFSVKIEVTVPDAYLFHLYTESGQLVFAETRELDKDVHILPFDLSLHELSAGIYFLRISDQAGEIRTKKIVKVK